jgi:hypothetical protein
MVKYLSADYADFRRLLVRIKKILSNRTDYYLNVYIFMFFFNLFNLRNLRMNFSDYSNLRVSVVS